MLLSVSLAVPHNPWRRLSEKLKATRRGISDEVRAADIGKKDAKGEKKRRFTVEKERIILEHEANIRALEEELNGELRASRSMQNDMCEEHPKRLEAAKKEYLSSVVRSCAYAREGPSTSFAPPITRRFHLRPRECSPRALTPL